MKITCPKCGSQEINFGKDFIQGRYWLQTEDEPTYWHDWEDGENSYEVEGQDINCVCNNCNYDWLLEGDLNDYLD